MIRIARTVPKNFRWLAGGEATHPEFKANNYGVHGEFCADEIFMEPEGILRARDRDGGGEEDAGRHEAVERGPHHLRRFEADGKDEDANHEIDKHLGQ